MKCQLTRELNGINPAYNAESHERFRQRGQHYPIPRLIKLPIGHIVDKPDCWRMVRHGVAVPLDEECAQAARMTAEQFAAAEELQEKLAARIWPEDYAAYDAGLMVGYNPDGTFKPGPNYKSSRLDAFRDLSAEGDAEA